MTVMLAEEGLRHLSTSIRSLNTGFFWVEELTAESFYKNLVKFQKVAQSLNSSM